METWTREIQGRLAFPIWVFDDVAVWSHILGFNLITKPNIEINICIYSQSKTYSDTIYDMFLLVDVGHYN